MKTSKTLIAAAIAALIPLGAAVAGDGAKDKAGTTGATFDKLDTNRDGRISQAEASVDANIMFTTADANGDGYLDKSEWKSHENKGSSSPAPQSMPEQAADPSVPQASDPAPADTETPRQ